MIALLARAHSDFTKVFPRNNNKSSFSFHHLLAKFNDEFGQSKFKTLERLDRILDRTVYLIYNKYLQIF